MTAALQDHVVFVDFENVPNIDLALIGSLSVRVILLLGKNQRRLELGLVQEIHRLGDRIQLIEVGASGHNALDLTLAFHLGRAVTQGPAATFHIVSKDSDFDPLVAHLRANGVAIGRHPSFEALPFLSSSKKTVPPLKVPEDRRAKVFARLTDPANMSRPTTQRALLAYIKGQLGKVALEGEPEDILRDLAKEEALMIDSATGKVSYVDAREPAVDANKIQAPSPKIPRVAKNQLRRIGKGKADAANLELLF